MKMEICNDGNRRYFVCRYLFVQEPGRLEIYDNNIDSTLYTNVGELTEGSKVSQRLRVHRMD